MRLHQGVTVPPILETLEQYSIIVFDYARHAGGKT